MQVTRRANVTCPRCHKRLSAQEGIPEVDCDCHLYCSHGTKPSDCTMVAKTAGPDAFTGRWKWPSGLHNQEAHEGDDTQARAYYCTTHNVYSDKMPISVEVDWSSWYGKRAPRKHRMSKGKY